MRKSSVVALFVFLTACNSSNATPVTQVPGSGSIDTDFVVSGRYIDLSEAPGGSPSVHSAAGKNFFIKGLVYWPTPIGKGVADAPMLDDALRDGNMAVWSRDLPLMRAMGANAIHVYNVVPPP
ncbi:MAG: hypothetical protein ACLQHL_10420 [Candidatus Cybelea sp.]